MLCFQQFINHGRGILPEKKGERNVSTKRISVNRRRVMGRILASLLFLLFLSSNSMAQGGLAGRCNGKIIKPGVHKMFLINNCGEPDHVESPRGSLAIGAVEKLYYNSGSDLYTVEILDGKVNRISKDKVK
jgi:hypothetical protein